jgi:hypothetical protein
MKTLVVLAVSLAWLPCQAQQISLRQLDAQCGNDRPLPSEWDSLYGPWPELNASATWAVLSPDRSLLAFTFEKLKHFPMKGIMIVDARTGVRRAFIPGQVTSEWHPHEHKLLMNHYIYDVDADDFSYLPEDPDGNGINHWSPDGKYVYMRYSGILMRTDADGKNPLALTALREDFIAISDTLFFTIARIDSITPSFVGIDWRGISGMSRRVVELPRLRELHVRNITTRHISPDGRFVVADYQRSGGKFDTTNSFLGMVDLQLYTLKKVVLSQRLGNEYFPSWTQEGTLIVSYVCRDDSVYGVWEMDTNGVFIRQFVTSETLRGVLASAPAAAVPAACSIRSFYPHPALDEGVLEYEVSMPGVYSIRILDAAGRIVLTPFEGVFLSPGPYSATIRTDGIPPGLYLVRVSAARGGDALRTLIVTR